jgi:hypothetical protein
MSREMVRIWIDETSLRVPKGVTLNWLVEGLRDGAGFRPELLAVDARYVPPEDWQATVLHAECRVNTVGG